MLEHEFALADADRRIANLIQLGTVHQADYRTARLKIKIGELITGWLPWITARAGFDQSWWAPEVGEQVVVLSPSGEMSQGVVLGSVYQQKHNAPESNLNLHKTVYKDGTVVEYNRESHSYLIDASASGSITLKVGGSTVKINSEEITLKAKTINISKT